MYCNDHIYDIYKQGLQVCGLDIFLYSTRVQAQPAFRVLLIKLSWFWWSFFFVYGDDRHVYFVDTLESGNTTGSRF